VTTALRVGDAVEVHTTFDDEWVPGYEIAEVADGGFRVCRTSDRSLLPNLTGAADVRALSTPRFR
jgi:hypothetical protein